jgi:taurine dioxygenase
MTRSAGAAASRVASRITPLSPRIGAVVEGLDLAQPLETADIDAIRQALLRHRLLVFRGQRLTPRAQRDFAARFGRLHVNPISPNHPEVPEIMVLHVDREHRPERALWHTDVTFAAVPPGGAVLHCLECPDSGGDTIWCSTAAALETLSAPIRAALDGLTAEHDFTKYFRARDYASAEARARWEQAVRDHPPVVHPVVARHPTTGEQTLFVNEGFTTRIVELQDHESDALLGLLFAHMIRPELTYRHRWEAGDVVFWDNRATAHYPVDDYWPKTRRVHRATILADG